MTSLRRRVEEGAIGLMAEIGVGHERVLLGRASCFLAGHPACGDRRAS